MGSFVSSNVSICDILNFVGRGKCSTPVVNGDSVCCTRATIETGARPFTASFMWLSSYWMPLNLCSHDRSPISYWMSPSLLLSLPSLSSLRFSPGDLQGSCSLACLVSPFPSASRGGLRCCSPQVIVFWTSRACCIS